ncbi:hypothetical protein OC25_17440 [Pedobacter kyungheensis]|uniref:Uncharacterized protein n=1 Tax=Pedobacter kyungheensis TaxID=1069985 RepID=A0A0C1DE56_9SPHI|nr:hypothetical protein [Pedobacter kyungheensis]KIA92225.1 hypothetical protein OC25_17440 [Pedobacter kyungheensis]
MNTKFKLTTVIIFLLSACHKEPINSDLAEEKPVQQASLSLEDAKGYIDQIEPDSAKVLSKISIDWTRARNNSTGSGNKWTILLNEQPTYQGYKQGYRELVILRDKNRQKIAAKILEIIPEAIYLQTKRKISASDFTGRVFEYDLNYNLTGGRLYSSGKPVGLIRQIAQKDLNQNANQKLLDVTHFRGAQGKLMLRAVETCVWVQDFYIDAEGDFTVHSTQVCSTSFIDDGGSGGGYYDGIGGGSPEPQQGGGGGGSASPPSPPPPSNLPGENNNTVNPREMMECFSQIPNPNAAFVVRVYVVEPQPGTSFNVGANSFGHVAISLTKTSGENSITQTVGFYPTGVGLDKLSSRSQIIDNGFDAYNISSTYYVTGENFQKVIDFISNPPKNYHFTDYNCSAFVYSAGQAGGIPIPDPTTQIGLGGPGGAGYAKTPAGMASALREQKAKNPNLDINEAGGKIPESHGPCKIQ